MEQIKAKQHGGSSGRGMYTTPRARSRAGVTLLELLLVMALLASIFGAGLGVFSALDVEQRQAAGVVKEVLRAARNSALTHRAPARVRIDDKLGTLEAMRLDVIGTWSFEPTEIADEVVGAFELNGRSIGGRWIENGWIGSALSFTTGGVLEIPVQIEPNWDLSEGFLIELTLRREAEGGGRLLRIGDTLGVDVGGAGELRAWIVPAIVGEDMDSRAGGRIVFETASGSIPVGRWVRLRFSYDRKGVELSADSIPLARVAEDRPLWKLDGPLILSDEQRPFPGAVDALIVSAVIVGQPQQLPLSVRIASAPDEVRFGPDGALDHTVHEGPVALELEFESGVREVITVGVYGTIE
ncbi:MAG: prepilin-type N-terminal cleavage/methylation domain-containing protein [Planctomycetota bacterium]|jgi:prepilin-type N-terminal cleavage/methylation domain-containing protein